MSLLYAGRHVHPNPREQATVVTRQSSAVAADEATAIDAPRRGDQGRGVQATWTYTLGSILFLFVVLDAILLLTAVSNYSASQAPVDAVLIVLYLVSAALHIRYCWFLRVGLGGGMPRLGWTLAVLAPAVATWVLGLFTPDAGLFAALPLWIALNVIAPLLPSRRRWALLLIGAVGTVVHPILASTMFGQTVNLDEISRAWLLVTYGAMLPVMVLTSLWWWAIVVTLDRHRSIAAELAVAQERLRFASDLHDIQGHHLQVIALKSELAERMLAIDPEAAREHVHETRLIAKQALEETRSLVAGYREVDLAAELENAREVLAAAGADCDLTVGALPPNAEVARTLALVVREATTNILRHSEATRASIRLASTADGSTLEIDNNGVVSATDAPGHADSSGLAGLRDRASALNGQLTTEADGDRFALRVFVPSKVRAEA